MASTHDALANLVSTWPVGSSFPTFVMTTETPTQHELEVFLDKLRLAKAKSNLTFADLAEKLERDELYVAAMYVAALTPASMAKRSPRKRIWKRLTRPSASTGPKTISARTTSLPVPAWTKSPPRVRR